MGPVLSSNSTTVRSVESESIMPEPRRPLQPNLQEPQPFCQKELIQLTELAVLNKLPPGVTEEDMYLALDKCGMSVSEIFDEMDRRAPNACADVEHGAFIIELILYERFGRRLREVTAHRSPI
jgi:hypothetical protein